MVSRKEKIEELKRYTGKDVIDRINDDDKYFVFLDEIQNIKDFEKAIDGLYLKKNVDLYVTGSNANLLSGELATLLSGRYVEIKMMPYSFEEFSEAYNKEIDVRKNFKLFLLKRHYEQHCLLPQYFVIYPKI